MGTPKMLQNLIQDLNNVANPQKAKVLSGFFKTGKGEYGEGDVFLGITVPKQRKISKKYINLRLTDVQKLLKSKIHEHRLVALLVLIEKYRDSKKAVFDFYLKNINYINNWDLVDLSAPNIVGDYLFDRPKEKLYNLAKSQNLWFRRISIIATYNFIRKDLFKETLKISKILISDQEDLIHKAVGWMLREVGKRNQKLEKTFLNKFAQKMPRTMLRYSIEKFTEPDRKKYLNLK